MPVKDTCVYCGAEYYPMTRWYKPYAFVAAGEARFYRAPGITVCWKPLCRRRAKRAGYVRRPDLTPRR